MAGINAKDIDIAEIYDGYPIFPLITLEGLGICQRGEAGRFVLEGNTWPDGKMPMTTNGGMLGQGHTGAGGGIAVLVEAIRPVSYTHLRAHETRHDLVCRLLLEKK